MSTLLAVKNVSLRFGGLQALSSVSFEVHEGDSTSAIGRNLKTHGVVASVDAFTSAAADNPNNTRRPSGASMR